MKCISPVGPALLCALLATLPCRADDAALAAGIRAYDDGQYEAAVESFQQAIRIMPQDSSLHHWLGKCYGRIAERHNWFGAISYAKKTLEQFRKAVELDADNYEALRDLIDYLETAPGLLGGNKREANQLRPHLEALRRAHEAGNG